MIVEDEMIKVESAEGIELDGFAVENAFLIFQHVEALTVERTDEGNRPHDIDGSISIELSTKDIRITGDENLGHISFGTNLHCITLQTFLARLYHRKKFYVKPPPLYNARGGSCNGSTHFYDHQAARRK